MSTNFGLAQDSVMIILIIRSELSPYLPTNSRKEELIWKV